MKQLIPIIVILQMTLVASAEAGVEDLAERLRQRVGPPYMEAVEQAVALQGPGFEALLRILSESDDDAPLIAFLDVRRQRPEMVARFNHHMDEAVQHRRPCKSSVPQFDYPYAVPILTQDDVWLALEALQKRELPSQLDGELLRRLSDWTSPVPAQCKVLERLVQQSRVNRYDGPLGRPVAVREVGNVLARWSACSSVADSIGKLVLDQYEHSRLREVRGERIPALSGAMLLTIVDAMAPEDRVDVLRQLLAAEERVSESVGLELREWTHADAEALERTRTEIREAINANAFFPETEVYGGLTRRLNRQFRQRQTSVLWTTLMGDLVQTVQELRRDDGG